MKKISGILLLSSVLNACGGSTPTDPRLDQLNEARALWNSYGIDAYRMEVEHSCYCLPDNRHTLVTVSPTEIAVLAPDSVTYLSDHPSEFSIEILFNKIEEAILNSESEVVVEFDSKFGYPKIVDFDPIKGVADDEVSYQINLVSHYELSQTVATMKALWESQQLDSYQMDYFVECFQCSIRQTVTTVEVEAGEAVGAFYTEVGLSADLDALSRYPVTVDQMFASLEYHLKQAKSAIDVTFSDRGYPTALYLDPNIAVFDDQVSLTVSALR